MKTGKLTPGEVILLASGTTLLITSFLPLWATREYDDFPGVSGKVEHLSAWSSAYSIRMKLALVLTSALLTLVVAKLIATRLVPSHHSLGYLLLAGTTLLLMIVVMLFEPSLGGLDPEVARKAGIALKRGGLLFGGLLLAGTMCAGAYLHLKDPGVRTGLPSGSERFQG